MTASMPWGVSSLKRADRKAREKALFDAPDETLDEIIDEVSEGLGLAGFCRKHDVRYRVVMEWLMLDVARTAAFENAKRVRAGLAVETAEAIGRKMAAPADETGIEWLDNATRGVDKEGEPMVIEMDPKAARVAHEAYRWAATVGDRQRFGKVVRHEHSMQVEHLQALKSSVVGKRPADSPFIAEGREAPARLTQQPIDAEFRALPPPDQAQTLDVIRSALRIRVHARTPVNVG